MSFYPFDPPTSDTIDRYELKSFLDFLEEALNKLRNKA